MNSLRYFSCQGWERNWKIDKIRTHWMIIMRLCRLCREWIFTQTILKTRRRNNSAFFAMMKPLYSFCQWGAIICCAAKPKQIQFFANSLSIYTIHWFEKSPKGSKGIVVDIVSLVMWFLWWIFSDSLSLLKLLE